MARNDDWKRALGATLISVENTAGVVTLHTNRGSLRLAAVGDCCSSSWFESVDDLGAVGGEITEIDLSGEYKDITEGSGEECLQAYFPIVKTTKGRVCMEMRNSSNGYYGGYIVDTWVAG